MNKPRHTHFIRWLAALFAVFILSINHAAIGGDALPGFRQEIAPILAQKCLACHNAEKNKGGFRLDSYEWLMKPGSSKEQPVIPGKPLQSKLYQLLVAADPDDRMPQKDEALPASQIQIFEKWILAGARFDGPDPKATLATIIPRPPHPQPPVAYPRAVPITALAFHPFRREIYASGYHEITVWSAETGKLLSRLTNIAERTVALAINADGSKLAVAGGSPGKLGEARIINPETGATLQILSPTSDLVLAAIFSPDGQELATGGTDNTIRIFDLTSGKQRLAIEQHADWVMDLSYSPDGSQIVSASRDKSARLFLTKTGEMEASYLGHENAVLAVAFAGDGKSVYSAGRDVEVHRWKTQDSKKQRELKGITSEVNHLLATSAGIFSAGVDGRVRLHGGDQDGLVRTYEGLTDRACSLAYDAKANEIAAGDYRGNVFIWKVADGAVAAKFVAAPGYVTSQASK